MTVDAYIDPITGDLAYPTRVVTGIDLIAQRVKASLMIFLGEWFLDPTIGVGWISAKEARPYPLETFGNELRATIEGVPGVDRVEGWSGEFDPIDRTATYSGAIVTSDGEVTVTVGPDGDAPSESTSGNSLGYVTIQYGTSGRIFG